MTASNPIALKPVLDHIVINVAGGMNDAARAHERLGFQLTPRGHHSLGTINHLAIFEENYLELLGYPPGGEQSRPDLWLHPAGLTGLVFKAPDPEAVRLRLEERGIAFEPPGEFTRPVALAEGTKDARFRVIRIASELVANGRTFFCHHFTPELVWRPEWQSHPNGATGIVEYVIAAADPAKTAGLYDRIFGPGLLKAIDGGFAFTAGKATVSILSGDAVAARFGDAAPGLLDGADRMSALVIASTCLDKVRSVLDGNGIAHAASAQGGLVVSKADAAGLAIAFVS